MNKIIELFKKIKGKWADETLYKTSLTKNNTLFQLHTMAVGYWVFGFIAYYGYDLLKVSLVLLILGLFCELYTLPTYKNVADKVVMPEDKEIV